MRSRLSLVTVLLNDGRYAAGSGALECFDVVNGSGVSPALANVIRDVDEKFHMTSVNRLSLDLQIAEVV